MRHAADWERDRADVKFAWEDRPSELLNDIFERIPIVSNDCGIVKREATVFVSFRVPEVVSQIRDGPIE